MAPHHGAFFRNLNVGQRGSPTTAELVEAFERAGATEVATVRSNGTVLFYSSAPVRTRDQACSWLIRHSDWCDIAPVRDARWLLDLGDRLTTVDGSCEVALYDVRRELPVRLPWRPDNGRITIVAGDRRHAIAVNDEPSTSYATPVLESLLGARVTSRGADTMTRVADLLAARGR